MQLYQQKKNYRRNTQNIGLMYKLKIVITKICQDNLHTLSCPYWIDYHNFKTKFQQGRQGRDELEAVVSWGQRAGCTNAVKMLHSKVTQGPVTRGLALRSQAPD